MENVVSRCEFDKDDIIDNTYRVEKRLGEGTYGSVYKVTDSRNNVFALKLLKLWEIPPQVRSMLIKRFDMEYETGQIKSKYLVHSVGKGFVCGNPYILMEFCPNGDLLGYVEKYGKSSLNKLALQVLFGLRDLHKCGKIHRDLKPENVLINDKNEAVLTDFGISGDQNKRMTERNIVGKPKSIFGTYGYMPPEQVRPPSGNATVLPTTDIFSFGVMIYQIIVNEMPFGKLEDNVDLANYCKNGANGNWNRQKLLYSPEGEKWISVIEGCLKPDFKQRLQSVDDVIAEMTNNGLVDNAGIQQNELISKTANEIGRGVNGVMLRIMQGEQYGSTYRLNDMVNGARKILTIGRNEFDSHNDIGINEIDACCYVSRKHCTLEFHHGVQKWFIRDGQFDRYSPDGWKRSLNGTFINASQVDMWGMEISIGDIITIGEVKLRVEGY